MELNTIEAEMDTAEGNKLIDAFLASGIEPIPSGMKNEIVGFDYHSDMKILSLVCNKIKKFSIITKKREKPNYADTRTYCELRIKLEFDGPYHTCESYVSGHLDLWRGPKFVRLDYPFQLYKDTDPCKALWKAIVSFIQWYNSQSTTASPDRLS